jgi:hypothetical protein
MGALRDFCAISIPIHEEDEHMARLQGPLHSEGAAGTLARCIIYSSWRGHPYARMYPAKVHQPGTPAQREGWNRFAAAHAAWKKLTPAERAAWTALGAPHNRPGYHQFMHVHAKAEP